MSHVGSSRYFDAASKGAYQTDLGSPQRMPLRQKGSLVYEENCRLALIVASLTSTPSKVVTAILSTKGVDVAALASSIDIVPTLMDWAS